MIPDASDTDDLVTKNVEARVTVVTIQYLYPLNHWRVKDHKLLHGKPKHKGERRYETEFSCAKPTTLKTIPPSQLGEGVREKSWDF